VAAGLAKRCEVQVAYAIGVAKPMGVYVHTFGTGKLDDEKLAKYVAEKFDFPPPRADSRAGPAAPRLPRYRAYGHFGRPEFSWEKTRPRQRAGRRSRWQRAQGPRPQQRRVERRQQADKAPAKKDKKAGKGKSREARP